MSLPLILLFSKIPNKTTLYRVNFVKYSPNVQKGASHYFSREKDEVVSRKLTKERVEIIKSITMRLMMSTDSNDNKIKQQ